MRTSVVPLPAISRTGSDPDAIAVPRATARTSTTALLAASAVNTTSVASPLARSRTGTAGGRAADRERERRGRVVAGRVADRRVHVEREVARGLAGDVAHADGERDRLLDRPRRRRRRVDLEVELLRRGRHDHFEVQTRADRRGARLAHVLARRVLARDGGVEGDVAARERLHPHVEVPVGARRQAERGRRGGELELDLRGAAGLEHRVGELEVREVADAVVAGRRDTHLGVDPGVEREASAGQRALVDRHADAQLGRRDLQCLRLAVGRVVDVQRAVDDRVRARLVVGRAADREVALGLAVAVVPAQPQWLDGGLGDDPRVERVLAAADAGDVELGREDLLAVGRDGVALGRGEVGDEVDAGAAVELVRADAAGEHVVQSTAGDRVVPGAAVDDGLVERAGHEAVVAAATGDRLQPISTAVDRVRAIRAVHRVRATRGPEAGVEVHPLEVRGRVGGARRAVGRDRARGEVDRPAAAAGEVREVRGDHVDAFAAVDRPAGAVPADPHRVVAAAGEDGGDVDAAAGRGADVDRVGAGAAREGHRSRRGDAVDHARAAGLTRLALGEVPDGVRGEVRGARDREVVLAVVVAAARHPHAAAVGARGDGQRRAHARHRDRALRLGGSGHGEQQGRERGNQEAHMSATLNGRWRPDHPPDG